MQPRPPSSLGLQQSFHLTFDFLVFRAGPDHRNAAHRLSISCIHCLGNLNADIQKFVRLRITEPISCNLPAKVKNLAVQEPIRALIFSIKGAFILLNQ
ncbi:hypothetical protein N665_0066s0017 [Sinapis alba]|nr:hypothetical protein N665_0066s0017 [Sinapis alba]